MQPNPQFHPPPPQRADTYSPSNSTAGSDWSGMNNYNGGLRAEGYHPHRGDSMTPPDAEPFDPRPPHRAQTFAAGSPTEQHGGRGPSENGSRASSRAGSSRNSDMSLRDPRSQRYQRAESELRQHYAVLRAYLKGGAAQPPRTNKARDKLLRLSPVQFHELSTDVFDELQRRQAAQPIPGRPPRMDKVPPFLQPRTDFHEKRNQARQKLSSLQISRFRDLSTDVFCELERRFPHFNPDNKRESTRSLSRGPPGRLPNGMPPAPNGFGPPSRSHTTNGSVSSNAGFPPRKGSIAQLDINASNELGRPMPKQFQSNTITPNKSTMIEDDDEDDESGPMGRYDRSSEAFGLESSLRSPGSNRDTSATSMTGGSRDVKSLQSQNGGIHVKVGELERQLEEKESEMSGIAALKDELQQKLDQAQSLNESLRREIEKLKSENESISSRAGSNDSGEWQNKHQELEEQHRQLQSRHEQQMRTTEEVSKQFRAHMVEMRAFADESSGSMQREEQLHLEVQRLKEENAEWKSKYTKARSQMKNLRMSSLGLNVTGSSSVRAIREQTFYSADGAVSDDHLTKFQLSVDGLLNSARGEEPAAVLDHVKELVVAVRSITGDVEKTADSVKDDEIVRKRDKLKGKVSATANNLITASKNFVAAHGLSPVSLVDAAASHLTAAVVDLLKIVKVRPAAPRELDDEAGNQHLTPVNKNGYFKVDGHVRRGSGADSIYSALSDPPEPDPRTPVGPTHPPFTNGDSHGLGIHSSHFQQDDVELEELKIYVGNQVDVLVQNVQALVGSVRNDEMLAMRNHANSVLDIVDIILAATEGGFEQASSYQATFTREASSSYDKLGQSKAQFETAIQESAQPDTQSSAKEFASRLPPLAFSIARDAKELAAKIENVSTGDSHDGAEDFS